MQVVLVLLLFFPSFYLTTEIEEKIIGGSIVNIIDYPYQISLQLYDEHICGGSIIDRKWVLTASHCIYELLPSDLKIKAGGSQLDGTFKNIRKISNIYQHPQYNPETSENDIALILVDQDFDYQEGIQPIKLASEIPPSGAMAVVTGWGDIIENGEASNDLRMVKVPVIHEDECKNRYYEDLLKDGMFCAGIETGGIDSCQGDSGGPLAFNGDLIGVVSFGLGCARPNAPGVYTNVPNFSGFVKQIMDSVTS